MTSLAVICTAATQSGCNLLGEVMDWGPNSYSIALSADGQAPATHYAGYGAGGITPTAVALINAFLNDGTLPDGLTLPDGVTEADILALRPHITAVTDTAFDTVLADQGLQQVQEGII